MTYDVFKDLAAHVVQTGFSDIPQPYLQISQMSILDALGTLIAGSCEEGCREIVSLVKEWGGREESTIGVHGGKVTAHTAAMANAVMARALDFDDAEDNGMHKGAALVPTALAVSEKLGGVSGREFLTAVTLGADLASRINFANLDYHGFDPTLTSIIFGTTAAAGKMLGLNEEQMWNALGLAFNECSGSYQSNIDGVLSVRVNEGLAACEGIMSACFAQRGITGVKNIGHGVYGYFHLYANDKVDHELLTRDLGKTYFGMKTHFKLWPSCGATLIASDMMLEFVEAGLQPQDVESITVIVGDFVNKLVGHPFKIGDNPRVNAQFSLQYTIANVLLRGKPRIVHFSPGLIADDAVQEMLQKVSVVVDPGLGPATGLPWTTLQTTLEVNLKSGRKLAKTGAAPKGHPDNPIGMEEIIAKFRDNVLAGPIQLPRDNTERIIELVQGLGEVGDMNAFVPLLLPDGAFRHQETASGRGPDNARK